MRVDTNDLRLAGAPFSTSLLFKREVLHYVHIHDADPQRSLSWDDWSEEKERGRLKGLATWLNDNGVRQEHYPWGSVRAVFDSKAGYSYIVVVCQQRLRTDTATDR